LTCSLAYSAPAGLRVEEKGKKKGRKSKSPSLSIAWLALAFSGGRGEGREKEACLHWPSNIKTAREGGKGGKSGSEKKEGKSKHRETLVERKLDFSPPVRRSLARGGEKEKKKSLVSNATAIS